jgi:hypothetical protein
MAFVVNGPDPEAYLGLIRTPAKTVIQTGQLGAILLADALVVRCFLLHPYVTTIICIPQVYRTFIIWNHNYYIIVIPCMTFVATFSEFFWTSSAVTDGDHLCSLWGIIRYASTPHRHSNQRLLKDCYAVDCGIPFVQFCYYRVLNG